MIKQLVLSFLGIFCFGFLFAQSISPAAIVPQGDVSKINDTSLEWTLGEVFIHTAAHKEGIITQGTQQPVLLIDQLSTQVETENIYKGVAIQLYPNPVEAILHIDISSDQSKPLDISLVDLSGKNLLQTTGNAESDHLKLDMTSLATGIYFLHVADKEGASLQTFKISKVNN